jgi:glycosyltransferase involved in cell wall biosynthesis
MGEYDYVVQLSDTESMCITMYESLMQHTPVLVTPFPNAVEDIKDGVNGYVLPFDMKLTKEQIMNIVNKIPKNVDYKQKGVVAAWEKIFM